MLRDPALPNEGDLYKIYTVDNLSFEIRYGYHEENERGRIEPLPIFPNMVAQPVYTRLGIPVTAYVQAPCPFYDPRCQSHPEDWCGDCIHYGGGREKIGRCLCPERRLE
jgi:hypothetical protein